MSTRPFLFAGCLFAILLSACGQPKQEYDPNYSTSLVATEDVLDTDACIHLHRAGEAYKAYTAANGKPPESVDAWKKYLLQNDQDTASLYWLAVENYEFQWNVDPRANGTAVIAQSNVRKPQLLADGSVSGATSTMLQKAQATEPSIVGVAVVATSSGAAGPPPPPAGTPPPPPTSVSSNGGDIQDDPVEIRRAVERWIRLYEVFVHIVGKPASIGDAHPYFGLAGSMTGDFDDAQRHMVLAGYLGKPKGFHPTVSSRYSLAFGKWETISGRLGSGGNSAAFYDLINSTILKDGKLPAHWGIWDEVSSTMSGRYGRTTLSSFERCLEKGMPYDTTLYNPDKELALLLQNFVNEYKSWLGDLPTTESIHDVEFQLHFVSRSDSKFDEIGEKLKKKNVGPNYSGLTNGEIAQIKLLDQDYASYKANLAKSEKGQEIIAGLEALAKVEEHGPSRVLSYLNGTLVKKTESSSDAPWGNSGSGSTVAGSNSSAGESPEEPDFFRVHKLGGVITQYCVTYRRWLSTFSQISDYQSASAKYSWLRMMDQEFDSHGEELAAMGVLPDFSNVPESKMEELTELQAQHQVEKDRIAKLRDFKNIQKGFAADIPKLGPIGPARVKAKIEAFRAANPKVAAATFPERERPAMESGFPPTPNLPNRPELPKFPGAESAGTPSAETAEAKPTPSGAQAYKAGMKVEILWGSSWYPGKILQIKGSMTLISYDNHSDSFNEWVTPDRVRPLK